MHICVYIIHRWDDYVYCLYAYYAYMCINVGMG